MSDLGANVERFLFTAKGSTSFKVKEIMGKEEISEPFEFHILLDSEINDINPDSLVNKTACLTFVTQKNQKRHINGIILQAGLVSEIIEENSKKMKKI